MWIRRISALVCSHSSSVRSELHALGGALPGARQLTPHLQVPQQRVGRTLAARPQAVLDHLPALAGVPDDLGRGDRYVVEEGLVEVGLTGQLPDGRQRDTGIAHVDNEQAEVVMPGRRVGGPGKQQAILRVMRIAGPDLAARDPVPVLLGPRRGAKRGQVRACLGFGEALAPYLVPGQYRLQVAGPLFFRPERHHDRARPGPGRSVPAPPALPRGRIPRRRSPPRPRQVRARRTQPARSGPRTRRRTGGGPSHAAS